MNWIDFNYHEKRCVLKLSNINTQLSQKQIIDNVVQSIVHDYDNLYISLSGGMDSEFTAKCFTERGIKFKPLIVDYISNSTEVWWAYKWCYDNKIEPEVIRLSKYDFVNLCTRYAKKYDTAFLSAIDFIMYDYIDKLDGKLVSSFAMPYRRISCLDDILSANVDTNLEFATYDFMLDYYEPKKHPYNFSVYTPEMMYDMVKNISYDKPMQIALSEYYGVTCRPKIPALMNLALFGEELINSISKFNYERDLYTLELCDKDLFLKACEDKVNIECKFVKKTPQICHKFQTHVTKTREI